MANDKHTDTHPHHQHKLQGNKQVHHLAQLDSSVILSEGFEPCGIDPEMATQTFA